jgi:molybdopterin converting factor small subunit
VRPLVAINQAYAALDSIVQPNDEVALIPPVAGG